MLKRTFRMTPETIERLQSMVKHRGYANASAFVRAAIGNELRGHEDTLAESEQRLAANMEQIRKEIQRLGRTQQALFAYMDSLAKILLTCLPEPAGEAMEAAVTRARSRHTRLLRNAGQAMVGESQLAFQELVKHGEG